MIQLGESLFSPPRMIDPLCFLHHRKCHPIFGVNLSLSASRMRNRSLQAPETSLLSSLLSTSHNVKTLFGLKRRGKKKSRLLCFYAKPIFPNRLRLTPQGSCQQGHLCAMPPVGARCRAGYRSEGDGERSMGGRGDYEIPFRNI